MEERIKELEAMIVILVKRIEKLEGKNRIAPESSYLKELRAEAQKIVSKLP